MPSLASRCVPCGTCTEWYTSAVGRQDLFDAVRRRFPGDGIGDHSFCDIASASSARAIGCSSTTSVRARASYRGRSAVSKPISAFPRPPLQAPHRGDVRWSCGSGSAIPPYGPRSGCSSSVMPAPAEARSRTPLSCPDWWTTGSPRSPWRLQPTWPGAGASRALRARPLSRSAADLVGTDDRAGVDAAFEHYRRLEAIAIERNAGPVEG